MTSQHPKSTITVNKGSAVIAGDNTSFTTDLKVGSTVTAGGETHTVTGIESDTSCTVDGAWGSSKEGVSFTFVK